MRKDQIKEYHTAGCLTDCVAFLMKMHPLDVPLFSPKNAKNQHRSMKAFFKRNGYDAFWVKHPIKYMPQGYVIVAGKSSRDPKIGHCTIFYKGKCYYDPRGHEHRPFTGKPEHILIVAKTQK